MYIPIDSLFTMTFMEKVLFFSDFTYTIILLI